MQEKITHWFDSIRATDFSYLGQNPYWTIAAIALGLLILLLLYRIRPRRRIRAFKGETGYVEISRHALLELVHSACEQMPEVRKPTIKIKPRRRLNLSVRIRVDGTVQLRDTAAFLQTHLKDALENNLGVEKLGKIEILVTGIRASSRPKTQRPGVDLNEPRREPSIPTEKAPKNVPDPVEVPASKPVSSTSGKKAESATAAGTTAKQEEKTPTKPDAPTDPATPPKDAGNVARAEDKKSGSGFVYKKS